jgi:hypothetical protein
MGGRARTSDFTAVSDNDRVDALFDKLGKQVVHPYALPENAVKGYAKGITTTGATDIVAAPGASLFNYITQILVTNAHDTVGTQVDIVDETSGDILYTGYAAPVGGGYAVTLPVPLKQGTANKKIQAICGTTGANVSVSVSGYKGV